VFAASIGAAVAKIREAVRVAITENDQREFDRGNGHEMKNTKKRKRRNVGGYERRQITSHDAAGMIYG
jgi:hypothetical protein